jgi:hypothetical protein
MPVSRLTKSHHLVPGKKYIIDVQWNITNDLRLPSSHTMIGIFKYNKYIRGRTGSFDSGLHILLSRSRCESIFLVDGIETTVSAVNKFYEVIKPRAYEFAMLSKLYSLPLPLDLKKVIGKYLGQTRHLYYKRRNKTGQV